MAFRLLTDVVVVVHLAFILFVAVGGLLVWRWPWLMRLHAPAVAWGIAVITVGYLPAHAGEGLKPIAVFGVMIEPHDRRARRG